MPTVDGLPYPNSSATPDVPGDILALVNVLSRKNGSGVSFAANSAALAQLVTDGLIKEGMFAYQLDIKQLWYRETSTWVPANQIMHPHAEFTATSASVASGSAAAVGTLSYDAAASNNSTFVTGGSSTITVNEAGTYSLDVVSTVPVNVTGLTFVRFVDGAGLQGYSFGASGLAAIASPLGANFWVPAGTVLTLTWFHTSAANRVLTSRFKITRIA